VLSLVDPLLGQRCNTSGDPSLNEPYESVGDGDGSEIEWSWFVILLLNHHQVDVQEAVWDVIS
jgi:hypothetical protein